METNICLISAAAAGRLDPAELSQVAPHNGARFLHSLTAKCASLCNTAVQQHLLILK